LAYAEHLKLAVQTIRRYVLNREIPFNKIKKVIRFRLVPVGSGFYSAATPYNWTFQRGLKDKITEREADPLAFLLFTL